METIMIKHNTLTNDVYNDVFNSKWMKIWSVLVKNNMIIGIWPVAWKTDNDIIEALSEQWVIFLNN